MVENAAAAPSLLREARRRSRLTQRELAARAEVAQPVVAAYESGRRQPSLPALARLLRAAGFELDAVLRPVRALPDPTEAASQLRQVLDLADRLPQRHRRELAFPPLPS